MTDDPGVHATDGDGWLQLVIFDWYAPRLWAMVQPGLTAAADFDPDVRLLLRHIGRHAMPTRGGIPVAPPGDVALFGREYSSAEARAVLGCSRALLHRFQHGALEGLWFKRPGPGGHVLVFDADSVDALAAFRSRSRR